MITKEEMEKHRKHLLAFIDGFRENVERAVDFKGEWNVAKPSLHTIYQAPLPPRLEGGHHTRYTLEIDLWDSQFIEKGEEQ